VVTRRWLAAWAIAIAAVVAAPAAAQAQPGRLDPSFGAAGRAATATGLSSSWKEATIHLATAPDGSVVIATAGQLIRYLPNGRLDRGFGTKGRVSPAEIEGLPFQLADVAIDAAGRVIAFGTAEDPSTSSFIAGYPAPSPTHPTFAVILRYGAAGRLDPRFGGGDGIVRTDLGFPYAQGMDGSSLPLVRAIAGAVDASGRPLLVAATYGLLPDAVRAQNGWVSRLVARFTPDGTLDPAFGTAGVTVLAQADNIGVVSGSADRPLLVWGGGPASPRPLSWITSLRPDGGIAGNYGTGGTRTVGGGGGDLALDRSGRLLVLERPDRKPPHVLRLEPDGNLDRSYGRGGRATVKGAPELGALSSLAVDAQGRALLVGTSSRSASKIPGIPHSGAYVIVARLRSSGLEDRRFGHNGWIRTGFGRHTEVASPHGTGLAVSGPQAALDSQGRLVVAASASSPELQPSGIVLARYLLGP
jgi:uncharacterized delta-60 repeat protein